MSSLTLWSQYFIKTYTNFNYLHSVHTIGDTFTTHTSHFILVSTPILLHAIHSNTNLLLLIATTPTCTTTTSTNRTHTRTVTATGYSFIKGIFSCFQYIGFSDRMIGQYPREKDLQPHSYVLVQYSVLTIPSQAAYNHETNSSQHGPFPCQSLVQTPTFSNQQTSN
jgi:hypothetical protein